MVLWGTVVNAGLIVLGATLGLLFRNIQENTKETVLMIIGLAVAVLGIEMGMTSSNFVIVIVSLVIGTIIGEMLNIEAMFQRLGLWIESTFFKKKGKGKIAEGFVTASLIYVIGSMAILGALDSGLRNDHSVLITKGIIDGFMSIILSSTLGIGVLLSAIPVFLYQGVIAISAGSISAFIPEAVLTMYIQEMTATGGVMILAIGLNIAGLTKIRVANLLPGIVVVGVIVGMLFSVQ